MQFIYNNNKKKTCLYNFEEMKCKFNTNTIEVDFIFKNIFRVFENFSCEYKAKEK